MLISVKRHSTLSGNLWSVSKRKDMWSLTQSRIPPPSEQRSNLYGFENPANKSWAVGKESSSFVSDTSKIPTLLMICDARNWNLFLIELMLTCGKMGWLGFPSVKHFRLMFWRFPFSLSLSIWLLDRLYFLLQMASSSSSVILAYLSFFQIFLIHSKKFIVKRRDPDSFKFKPLRLKFYWWYLYCQHVNI